MTYDNFIQRVQHPEILSESDQEPLKELMAKYPYFDIARWLYLKSLHVSNSIYFNHELKRTALYAHDRRNLYFFIHPEEDPVNEVVQKERKVLTGSYFDMINILENKNESSRNSLQSLAAKLRAARQMLPSPNQQEITQVHAAGEIFITQNENEGENIKNIDAEKYEDKARNLIKEKKYEEAISVLEELNLINPKKSIYFADQIRFLRKIIKT